VLSVNDIAVISREQRSTWLDIAVLFTRHFDIDWWPSKRTPTHHHLAIQTSPPPIGQQQDLEDQTCVPVVMTMWAWCMSRSTVALAIVLGMSSSKPAGCRFDDSAMERFS
jgi:hypothetical protein